MQIDQDGVTGVSALSSNDFIIPPPTPLSAALTDDTSLSPVPGGGGTPIPRDDGNSNGVRTKPKQKRNKPTLSCLECGTSFAVDFRLSGSC